MIADIPELVICHIIFCLPLSVFEVLHASIWGGVVHNACRGNTSTGTERSTLLPGICGSSADLRRYRGRLCDFDGRVVARFVIKNTRWHRELREPSLVQPKIAISILDQRGCSLFLRPKASTSTLSHGHKLSHGPSGFCKIQGDSARVLDPSNTRYTSVCICHHPPLLAGRAWATVLRSCETSFAVPSRVSLLISILRLNLVLTFLPSSAAASIYLFKTATRHRVCPEFIGPCNCVPMIYT